MKKTFFVAQIRNLLNQVHNEKITFSRFVEILNEEVERQRKFNISKFDDNTDWSDGYLKTNKTDSTK